ncbi:MAG: SOS response-associated peptidase [Halanaerobiales bacterium]|nr:SOS response-associated peptidase [Halanaerobiales bacterium]
MCGRYFLNIALDELENRYGISSIPEELRDNQGEIFPSNQAPVLYNKGNNKKMELMKWGFKPSYSNNLVINARSESVHKKSLFKESFHRRRCIIPANGFFEWKEKDGTKIKHFIELNDENIISLAGIYDWFKIDGEEKISFCILTKDAPQELINIHDRIPVIIKKKFEDEWLEEKFTPRIFDYINSTGFDFQVNDK